MISPKLLILSLILFFIFGISHLSATETVVVNKSFNGREIKVRAGGLIRIDLKELGAAGYAWTIKELDIEHFEIVSVRTESPPPPSDITGVPVVRTWQIRTKKTGKAELKFFYYRPWEGEDKAVDKFFLKVLIL